MNIIPLYQVKLTSLLLEYSIQPKFQIFFYLIKYQISKFKIIVLFSNSILMKLKEASSIHFTVNYQSFQAIFINRY